MITTPTNCKKFHRTDIVKALENFIFDNEISGGKLLPTTAQLARDFNVSTKTVHRAMDILVNRHIVYRERGKGTFVCESVAPQTGTRVAFISLNNKSAKVHPLDYYAYDVLNGQLQELLLNREKCKVDLISIDPAQEIDSQLQLLNLKLYDIYIVSAGLIEKTALFNNYNRQMVLIGDAKFHFGDYNQTIIDYIPAFRLLLKQYHRVGIRNLFVVGTPDPVSQERYQALLQAARAEDLYFNFNFFAADWTHSAKHWFNLEPGLEQFDARRNGTWAMISLSDYLTLEMFPYWQKRNLTPGKDFLLASYDNLLSKLPEFANKIDFERIQHPLSSIALATVNICHAMIRKDNFSFTSTFTVPAEEIVWSTKFSMDDVSNINPKHVKVG